MTRLKNLYTHLISNRRREVDGWLKSYRAFSEDVGKIRRALNDSNVNDLRQTALYNETNFVKEKEPFQTFAKRLIYERRNPISSRGQSVLSSVDFDRFISDGDFISVLQNLIKEPNQETFDAFCKRWDFLDTTRHPLLTNRVLAACTTRVSTTVDKSKFNSVYSWLIKEGLIEASAEPIEDWYSKNEYLMSKLLSHFSDELSNGTTSEYELSIFVWELYLHVTNPFSLKRRNHRVKSQQST